MTLNKSLDDTLYCIAIGGIYGDSFYYTRQPDICWLAKYLNSLELIYGSIGKIERVYITESYLSKDKRLVKFFPVEYETQRFFETYEERLIEQHKLLTV